MKVQVIVGSTRPGRVSDKVAKWVLAEAKNTFDEAELIDLAEYTLPFFDELISPQYNPERAATPEVQKWLDKVAEADAYILVTPEYNRATSAVLKNALDHLAFEFAKKPVALVGHGGNGGAQAVYSLRSVVEQIQAVTVPGSVYFNSFTTQLSDEGALDAETAANAYGPAGALKTLVANTKWYADALKAAR